MRLTDWLQQEKITPATAADRIGSVTGEAVRLWAAGKRMPNTDQVERIFEVSGGAVTANDLHEACREYRQSLAAESDEAAA